ncbi:hypothetical protein [Flavobacterium sp.]|uniref:hypothetical protein n=1 Tax=Flavobacterium sp. TaxID=239 RepID=UPI00261AD4C2|nr:hypothetical protein [Flavobacterium sp.]
MKEWFKYEFGYINIDDHCIYLTNSGNWSETRDMSEKSKKTDAKADSKKSSVLIFFIAVSALFCYLIFRNLEIGRMSITLILLVTIGSYSIYNYLKSDIGSKFKIPLDKIALIEVNNDTFVIHFTDGESKDSTYKVSKIEKKGEKIIAELIEKINNK